MKKRLLCLALALTLLFALAVPVWGYSGFQDFLNATGRLKGVDYTRIRQDTRQYIRVTFEIGSQSFNGMLKKDDSGVYHIEGTTAYEGNAPTDDTLTDIVMIRCLFTALKDHVSGEYKERLSDVLEHLPDTELLPLDTDDWDGDSFTFGIGKGRKPLGDKRVFGIGRRDGKQVRVSYGDPNSPKIQYGFPDIELSPLYPAGIFGLKDKNSPLFDNMTNQLMLHNPGNECGHWNMLPVYLARMGMADEFIPNCRGMLEANQGFLNGFNAESSEPGHPGGWPDWYNYTETDSGEKRRLRSYDFIHFDFETAPIISQGMNESLLQSHEGVIRLFPAVKRGDPAAFSLYAEGGRATTASIFGEAGPEWAIPEEHSERTAALLDAARAASGFTWPDLLARYGGLNANANNSPTTLVYSPVINAQDARGVDAVLQADKRRFERWFEERRMREAMEVYA